MLSLPSGLPPKRTVETLELTADRPGERLGGFLARLAEGLSPSPPRRPLDEGPAANALLPGAPEPGEIPDTMRPGIVHRLDKDTSGLLVVARSERARSGLTRQLKEREVRKVYPAHVDGVPEPPQGVIEAPIGRHPRNRKKMAVVAGGREAETKYRIRETLGGVALVEVEAVTGRP